MLVVALGAISMQAQSKTPYPSMAALDRYLMPDRNAEIALARSAAPDSISHDAKILVLGPHGYETAVEGKNGFVCAVERGWMAPFDNPEFWNPKIRGPLCFNPPAVRSMLPMTYKRTEMVLAGQSKAQVMEGIATFAKKELPPLEPGAFTYMMSKQAYLTDAAWPQHRPFDVLHPSHGRRGLGRGSPQVSRHAESSVRPGRHRRIHGSYRRVVGWNASPGQ